MEVLFNQDCSYFNINLLGGLNASGDVISLQIDEEVQQFVKGSISFLDPTYKYTNDFRPGTKFQITWGYKNRNSNLALLSLLQKNPQELTTQGVRRGQSCIVTTPSWSCNEKGQIIYICRFMGGERENNTGKRKIYTSGTKYNLINQIFSDLGVVNTFINFETMKDNISAENFQLQNQTSFKFLLQLAYEWRCTFKIGYNQAGQSCGIFVDNIKVGDNETKSFIMQITGGTGSTKLLEYGIGSSNPNVSSWSGQQHIGDNGMGDGVRIDIIDGKPVFTKYVVEGNTIKAYRLNEKKIKKFAETHSQNSTEIMSNALKAPNMDATVWETTKVKDFFTPEIISTAPQGLGYSGTVEMLGDTGMTPYVELKFGNGFPPPLKEPKEITKFICKKVSHTLSANGYKISVGFADIITTFGGYVQ
jgi:hypothetical protein